MKTACRRCAVLLPVLALVLIFTACASPAPKSTAAPKEAIVIPFPDLEPEQEIQTPFSDIMGLSGYRIDYCNVGHQIGRSYYTQDDTCIARSYGFHDYEGEDIILDIDGDGVTELISNCVAQDGGQRLWVYRLRDGCIEVGWVDEKSLLPSGMTWRKTRERYEPSTDRIVLQYYLESDSDPVEFTTLELGFDSLVFEAYQGD